MELLPNKGISLYYQLKEVLREQIINKEFKTGELLPNESEISQMYGVSRATVRKAFQELVREGLVYRKQGKGSFVASPKIIPPLEEMSFTKQMESQGLTPFSKLLSKELLQASGDLKELLQLDDSSKAYKIVRLRFADNVPVVLETTYLSIDVFPDILEYDFEKLTIHKLLSEKYEIEKVTTNLEAQLPSPHAAKLLEISEKIPVFCIRQLVYSKNKPIVLNHRIIRGDKFQYHINFSSSESTKTSPYAINMELQGY